MTVHTRKGLFAIYEQAVDTALDAKRAEAMGQDSLFRGDAETRAAFEVPVPNEGEWDKATLLAFEREMLGLYVSDHPLLGVEHIVAANTNCSLGELLSSVSEEPGEHTTRNARLDGRAITLGGILSGVQRKVTRQGKSWATAMLEDLGGAIEVLCFPATYQQYLPLLVEDVVVIVKGRLEHRDVTLKLIAQEVSVLDLTVED